MKRIYLSLAILLTLMMASGCGDDDNEQTGNGDSEAGVPYPDVPDGMTAGNAASNKNFATLQRRVSSASVSPAPWAGYWWPYSTNGIAGAAAKHDLARGTGGSQSWEVSNHGQGLAGVADWWGHCNGWAAAALLMPEPKGPKTINGVEFSISDRKALLSEVFMEVTGDFLGNRVNNPGDTSSGAFRDIVPAQFYLMLTNVIGLQRRAFIMDRFTGVEVWNHPVVAYANSPVRSEDYLGVDPEFPQVHRVNVTTQIWWVEDNVDPNIVTPAFDPSNLGSAFKSRTLRYELWLDAAPQFDGAGNLAAAGDVILANDAGRAVGGSWKNGALPLVNSYPDYIWIPTGAARSSGHKNPRIDDAWIRQNLGG
ncbi:MAG: hypothetical protein AB1540_01225 [Bdellovibrionota bacterium]